MNVALNKTSVFRQKRYGQGNKESDILDMIRKFLSGDGLDDAMYLLGIAGPDETELPT